MEWTAGIPNKSGWYKVIKTTGEKDILNISSDHYDRPGVLWMWYPSIHKSGIPMNEKSVNFTHYQEIDLT